MLKVIKVSTDLVWCHIRAKIVQNVTPIFLLNVHKKSNMEGQNNYMDELYGAVAQDRCMLGHALATVWKCLRVKTCFLPLNRI